MSRRIKAEVKLNFKIERVKELVMQLWLVEAEIDELLYGDWKGVNNKVLKGLTPLNK